MPCPVLLDSKHLLEPNQTCISIQHIFILSARFQAVCSYIRDECFIISCILHLAIDSLNMIVYICQCSKYISLMQTEKDNSTILDSYFVFIIPNLSLSWNKSSNLFHLMPAVFKWQCIPEQQAWGMTMQPSEVSSYSAPMISVEGHRVVTCIAYLLSLP